MALEDKALIDRASLVSLGDEVRKVVGTTDPLSWDKVIKPNLKLSDDLIVANFTATAASVKISTPLDKINFIVLTGSGSRSYRRVFCWNREMRYKEENDTHIWLPLIAVGPYKAYKDVSWSYSGISGTKFDGSLFLKQYSGSYPMYYWYLKIDKTTNISQLAYRMTKDGSLTTINEYMVTSADSMILGVRN